MLYDQHHRIHNYLRISLTDACNFRCFYCMPEEEVEITPMGKLMTAEEIQHIAETFVALGVEKIRLTGGEPLVRKDFKEILMGLSSLPVRLTLTTNGALLHRFWNELNLAGVRSINISLDTLSEQKFELLTKRNHFKSVWQNVQEAVQRGLSVKLNMVVLKGINEEEILSFVELTQNLPIHIRFIEFMPFDQNLWRSAKVVSHQEIIDQIKQEYDIIKLQDAPHATTKSYQVIGFTGTFAVISTMTQPFCSTCNRIRLTADGKLKNCLFSKTETDILTPLREGHPITELIVQTISTKEAKLGGQILDHLSANDDHPIANRSMIKIGG